MRETAGECWGFMRVGNVNCLGMEMGEPWDLATIDFILVRFGAEKVASPHGF